MLSDVKKILSQNSNKYLTNQQKSYYFNMHSFHKLRAGFDAFSQFGCLELSFLWYSLAKRRQFFSLLWSWKVFAYIFKTVIWDAKRKTNEHSAIATYISGSFVDCSQKQKFVFSCMKWLIVEICTVSTHYTYIVQMFTLTTYKAL